MKIYDLIKQLLTDNPLHRNSDRRLMLAVWFRLGFITDHGDTTCITAENFMEAPSTETIRRCRQAIQAKYPELRGSEKIRKARAEKAEEKGTFIYKEVVTVQKALI